MQSGGDTSSVDQHAAVVADLRAKVKALEAQLQASPDQLLQQNVALGQQVQSLYMELHALANQHALLDYQFKACAHELYATQQGGVANRMKPETVKRDVDFELTSLKAVQQVHQDMLATARKQLAELDQRNNGLVYGMTMALSVLSQRGFEADALKITKAVQTLGIDVASPTASVTTKQPGQLVAHVRSSVKTDALQVAPVVPVEQPSRIAVAEPSTRKPRRDASNTAAVNTQTLQYGTVKLQTKDNRQVPTDQSTGESQRSRSSAQQFKALRAFADGVNELCDRQIAVLAKMKKPSRAGTSAFKQGVAALSAKLRQARANEEQLTVRAADIALLKQTNLLLVEANERLCSEKSQLELALSEERGRTTDLSPTITMLQEELGASKSQIKELQSANDELQQALSSKHEALKGAEKQCAQLASELASVKAKHRVAEKNFQGVVKSLKSSLTNMKDENRRLTLAGDKVRAELRAVTSELATAKQGVRELQGQLLQVAQVAVSAESLIETSSCKVGDTSSGAPDTAPAPAQSSVDTAKRPSSGAAHHAADVKQRLKAKLNRRNKGSTFDSTREAQAGATDTADDLLEKLQQAYDSNSTLMQKVDTCSSVVNSICHKLASFARALHAVYQRYTNIEELPLLQNDNFSSVVLKLFVAVFNLKPPEESYIVTRILASCSTPPRVDHADQRSAGGIGITPDMMLECKSLYTELSRNIALLSLAVIETSPIASSATDGMTTVMQENGHRALEIKSVLANLETLCKSIPVDDTSVLQNLKVVSNTCDYAATLMQDPSVTPELYCLSREFITSTLARFEMENYTNTWMKNVWINRGARLSFFVNQRWDPLRCDMLKSDIVGFPEHYTMNVAASILESMYEDYMEQSAAIWSPPDSARDKTCTLMKYACMFVVAQATNEIRLMHVDPELVEQTLGRARIGTALVDLPYAKPASVVSMYFYSRVQNCFTDAATPSFNAAINSILLDMVTRHNVHIPLVTKAFKAACHALITILKPLVPHAREFRILHSRICAIKTLIVAPPDTFRAIMQQDIVHKMQKSDAPWEINDVEKFLSFYNAQTVRRLQA